MLFLFGGKREEEEKGEEEGGKEEVCVDSSGDERWGEKGSERDTTYCLSWSSAAKFSQLAGHSASAAVCPDPTVFAR